MSVVKIGRTRKLVASAAALTLPVTATLVAVLAPSPAAAATCTGAAPTTLTIAPAEAVAEVGGTHTVTVDEDCQGLVGAGDPIVLTVRGTNPRTARGLTDAHGRITYTYDDLEGAGVDEITACTTALSTDVCTRATVTWECPEGQFPNGAGCSRVPAFDLPELSELSGFGLGRFGGFGSGLAERFLDDHDGALDDHDGALGRGTESTESTDPGPAETAAVETVVVEEELPPAEEGVVYVDDGSF